MTPEQTSADIAVLKEKVERMECAFEEIRDSLKGLAESNAGQIAATEAWCNAKTRAY